MIVAPTSLITNMINLVKVPGVVDGFFVGGIPRRKGNVSRGGEES
jgi:hypothetical protein